MTQQQLKHKGYTGSIEVSIEDACLHGRILHIDDLVTYEGETVADISQRFVEAVDRYLAHCVAINKQPGRPYSGSFNVRVGPDRHRRLAQWASSSGIAINEAVCQALDLLARPVASVPVSSINREELLQLIVPRSGSVQYKFATGTRYTLESNVPSASVRLHSLEH